MTNRFEIQLDVNEDEITLLCKALEYTASEKPARNVELGDLEAKIRLAWTKREVEIIPPPNKWSAHLPVADARQPSEGYPTQEMVRRWYSSA